VSLERIFAGWRSAYVSDVAQVEPADDECVFCALLATDGEDRERLIVHRGETCVALLNLYPYGSGHVLLMPYRHISSLDELTAAERRELFDFVVDASNALQKAYEPDGMNVGANLGRAAGAGVPGHLHFHALPRWSGDTNFMTAVGETRVIPEDLSTTFDKVSDAWPT
jgi:ATP adenylyltransferase